METETQYTTENLRAKYGDAPKSTEKFGYLMFFLGQNIIFGVMLAGINTFWQSVLAIPLTTIGTITLIARIWDAINDPLLAIVVQKRERGKYGKFKPWAFGTAFALPIVTMLSFVNINPDVNMNGGVATLPVILYAAIAYLMYGMTYTLCDMPAFSMTYTMESDTRKRSQLIVFGRIGAGIAGIFTSFIFWGIIGLFGGNEAAAGSATTSGNQGFLISAAVLMAIAMITMILIGLCKERNNVPSKEPVNTESVWKFVSRNKHIGKIILFKTIISFTTAFVYAGVSIIVLSGVLGNSETGQWMTIVFTSMSIMGFFHSLTLGPLIKKFGKRRTILVLVTTGFVLVTGGIIGMISTFNPEANANGIEGTIAFWPFILFQIGALFIMNTSISVGFAMTPDAVEYAAYRTGIRQEAIGQSVSSFTTKLDMGIAGMFSAFVLAAVGVQSGADMLYNQAAATAALNAIFISVLSIIIGGIAMIICWCVFWTLNRDDVNTIAQLNVAGKTDDLMDIKLGIHRTADTMKDRAVEEYREAKLAFDLDKPETIKTFELARINLRGANAHYKASYKQLRQLTKEHKARLKKEAKAAKKSK